MNRNSINIQNNNYDLLIIGGGIVGASAALDASLRGLNVLLVDKGDFGGATSASSGKMIHGGIRFMQHGAFLRVRESLHHRRVFLNNAPHLVHPIPFIIPTYGHGMKGKEILSVGMIIYELLGIDKNITKDLSKKIPHFKILSRKEILALEPEINKNGLTGGVLYYDCQMHTPERLTLAFIQSANENGADVLNYMQVKNLIVENNSVIGANTIDLITGQNYSVNSKFTLNASGPWLYKILNGNLKNLKQIQFSKGIHLVTESITNNHAIALATEHKQAKSLLTRGGRHFFIAPWKNHSLIGTTNVDFKGEQDDLMVTKKDIEEFLEEIKDSYQPASKIKLNDIKYFYGGLYLDDVNIKSNKGYQGHRHDQIIDHKMDSNLEGLLSVIGVKYTTSPNLAQKIVNKVVERLGKGNNKSNFEKYPIYGGDISNYSEFVMNAQNKYSAILDKDITEHLILNYGSKFEEIIKIGLNSDFLLKRIVKDLPFILAEVVYSVRFEMAVKLSDIFLRRLGLGTLRKPEENIIHTVAQLMAKELLWDREKIQKEIDEFKIVYFIE
ncbi:MAG: glycerol-3-phosphate dehydrogenase/oxidase [Melioribacteraceae bacterium]